MRWKCICAYDGTGFGGWQTQPDGSSVQDRIEEALAAILKTPVRIQGSARTDAGVHARGQCFHFDADWSHAPRSLVRALATELPETIAIRSLGPAPAGFHARQSARGKRYTYRFYLGRANPFETRYVWSCKGADLDFEAMVAAAGLLTGRHDFRAFAASHGPGEDDPRPVKTVTRMDLRRRGRHFALVTEGSGYLYRMVRGFAGALYEVGRGRLSTGDIGRLLASRRRTHRVVTAPARGLCLDRVFYPR
jgi:tRNA pseudouridine38-40 synthase